MIVVAILLYVICCCVAGCFIARSMMEKLLREFRPTAEKYSKQLTQTVSGFEFDTEYGKVHLASSAALKYFSKGAIEGFVLSVPICENSLDFNVFLADHGWESDRRLFGILGKIRRRFEGGALNPYIVRGNDQRYVRKVIDRPQIRAKLAEMSSWATCLVYDGGRFGVVFENEPTPETLLAKVPLLKDLGTRFSDYRQKRVSSYHFALSTCLLLLASTFFVVQTNDHISTCSAGSIQLMLEFSFYACLGFVGAIVGLNRMRGENWPSVRKMFFPFLLVPSFLFGPGYLIGYINYIRSVDEGQFKRAVEVSFEDDNTCKIPYTARYCGEARDYIIEDANRCSQVALNHCLVGKSGYGVFDLGWVDESSLSIELCK